MRPRSSLAARSSVGKHTARESEAPNVVRMGKSAWRAPTPEFGPDPARGPGLFLNIENHFSLSARRAGPGPEPTYPSRIRRADLSEMLIPLIVIARRRVVTSKQSSWIATPDCVGLAMTGQF